MGGHVAELAGASNSGGGRYWGAEPLGSRARPEREWKYVQVGERQPFHQCDGAIVVRLRLSGKSDDDVGAETEDRALDDESLDDTRVTIGGVPVASHALENGVRAGLERRVQMRRYTSRLLDEQRKQSLIDLRRLERREPEANTWNVAHEALDQLT